MSATQDDAAKKPKDAPRKGKGKGKKSDALAPDAVLELRYTLSALPSSQHKAGLAGLVLLVQWLATQPTELVHTLEVRELGPDGAVLRVDRAGLGRLFDELYDATHEDAEVDAPRKDKQGKVVEPKGTVEREVKEKGKEGKSKRKTYYLYEVTVPRARWVLAHDETREGTSELGAWTKLWRDMLWNTFRTMAANREPFEARADKRDAGDAGTLWEQLCGDEGAAVELPSTYFLGAQGVHADGMSFRDLARQQLLLHCWPYAAQVYVPQDYDVLEAKSSAAGFALVIPEVANLQDFVELLPDVLRARGREVLRAKETNRLYRPRAALVDLAVQSGLEVALQLRRELARREGGKQSASAVTALDVAHVQRDGNNVRLRSWDRVTPREDLERRYEVCRERYLDTLFRRQRIANLVRGRRWFEGFDRLCETTSYKKQCVGSAFFAHDARLAFEELEVRIKERNKDMTEGEAKPPRDLETLLYQSVRGYLERRTRQRARLDEDSKFEAIKANPEQLARYKEAKEHAAREAFLAVRSRTGADFVAYFAGSLRSAFGFLRPEEYQLLAQALRAQSEEVRTLTLLAISAHGSVWDGSAPKSGDDK